MKSKTAALALIVLALCAGAALGSDQKQPKPKKGEQSRPAPISPPAISVSAAAVRFNVQVRDHDGNLVTGLKAGNFRVWEDENPQQILFFEADESPVSVAVMVEFSRSLVASVEDIRQGVYFLVKNLRPDDYCAFLTFSNRPRLEEDFTLDRNKILYQVQGLNSTYQSGIELLSSVNFLLNRLEEVPGKKGIVLLATGVSDPFNDTKNLFRRLQTRAVPIYAVSIGQFTRDSMQAYLSETAHAALFQGDQRLRQLAENSGGMVFYPHFPTEFPKMLKMISLYLHHQYLVAYNPPNPGDLRAKRKLRMEASADIRHNGTPEKLAVFHVKEYTLAARAEPEQNQPAQ